MSIYSNNSFNETFCSWAIHYHLVCVTCETAKIYHYRHETRQISGGATEENMANAIGADAGMSVASAKTVFNSSVHGDKLYELRHVAYVIFHILQFFH